MKKAFRAVLAGWLAGLTRGLPICGGKTAAGFRRPGCHHCGYGYSIIHSDHVDFRADGTNAWCVYECIACGAMVTLHDWVGR